MKFGLFLGVWENPNAKNDTHTILREVIDYVVRAEALGYRSAFFTEHHFTGLPQIPSTMMVLSHLAARTSRMRLGTAVIILPWHNPLLIAEEIATLDLLSDGRFDCGIGRGFRFTECQGFGIPGEELGERFDEAVEVLEKAWAAPGRFSHQGKHWRFADAMIDPRAVQEPHPPVWVAVGSDGSVRKTAAQGYNILLDQFSDSQQIADRIAVFREAVEATGQTFDPMRVGVSRAFHITDSEAETREALEHHHNVLSNNRKLSSDPNSAGGPLYRPPTATGDAEDTWLIGTREQIVKRLHALKAGGVEYVLLLDTSGDVKSLERFASEIMPQFDDDALAAPQARRARGV
jgi:alkanesulfonate monooxygenase SsuD/methylene tetrahydromethanopterin reductase-like flavin-dependent oxidoreductase (luciferase family)